MWLGDNLRRCCLACLTSISALEEDAVYGLAMGRCVGLASEHFIEVENLLPRTGLLAICTCNASQARHQGPVAKCQPPPAGDVDAHPLTGVEPFLQLRRRVLPSPTVLLSVSMLGRSLSVLRCWKFPCDISFCPVLNCWQTNPICV